MDSKQTYRQLCDKYPIPVFLQYWWLDAVSANWDVAIAQKGEQITGVWPYALDRKAGVNILRTPLLTPYAGPFVIFPTDVKDSNLDGFEHDTISTLFSQLPDAKVWNVSGLPGLKQAGLFRSNNLTLSVQQTFLIDLSKDIPLLLADMKESLRRNIKAAEKEISISNEPALLKDLFSYQAHTLKSKDKSQAYTLSETKRLMDACLQHNAGALWAARKGDELQALVWNVWDKDTSYYFMGAQNPESDNYRALSALLWHSIKEAKARGNTVFDMEGSMDQGVERFFRSFAGRRELYLVLKRNDSLLWRLKELLRS